MLGTRSWVTYAGNEEEAWKCIGLARSGHRVCTRRQWAVILSDSISAEIRRVMQEEVQIFHFLKGFEGNDGLSFEARAKDCFQQSPKFRGSVFLNPNCLMVKNGDFLFHEDGVHGIVDANENVKGEAIIAMQGKAESQGLKKLDCCFNLDMQSAHPIPVPGTQVTMVYFANGHPIDCGHFQPVGEVAVEIVSLWRSLCPEVTQEIAPFIPQRTQHFKDSIAIIGMGCRYPLANTLDEFWDLLSKGIEGIRKVPEGRWTKDQSIIVMDNTRNTEAGFLSCPIDTFDAKFFNINGADAGFTDPQQRLALRVVWEALEHACIDPLSLKGSLTGVFGGWWREDYKEMLQMVNLQAADFLRGYMGNGLGPLTAKISHFYELIGPAYSTESGCSTSIAGVTMGCSALRNEECNLAVCVGINMLLQPYALGSDGLEGVLAPDGRCKVFDESADGFGRAEGVGVLILKRYPDAVRDGDRVWGVIRGEAIVQEGTSKSMGTPTVDVEAKAMELALRRANVTPSEIDFVEMHATGTPVGDPIEAAAVARVYSRQKRDKPLLVGSVKGNVGHTESVCGITSIQKMVLAMKNELIPQNLNLSNMQPEIVQQFEKIPAIVPLEPQPWKRDPNKPRICAINSFGITGAQADIIVQEPPKRLPTPTWSFQDKRELKILTFSGKFKDAVQRNIENCIGFLGSKDSPELQDIEYNMHIGRSHLYFRHFVLGKTKEDIIDKLKAEEIKGNPIPGNQPNVGFLFTGQGFQYPGMGKKLYERSIVFKSHFDWCESIVEKEHGILGLKEALLGSDTQCMGKSSLHIPVLTFVVEYCLLRLWESWGIRPKLVLGHSAGEFVAVIAAGIMAPEDALNLFVNRCKLISSLSPGKMLALMISAEKANEILKVAFPYEIPVDIAATNTVHQTVVAGPPDAVDQLKIFCDNNGIKSHMLDSPHAFHSRMMDPILEECRKVAEGIRFSPASKKCRYISSTLGKEIERTVDADYWVNHAKEKVNFIEASKAAVESTNVSIFIEVGPHPLLSALLLDNTDGIVDDLTCLPSIRRDRDDWEVMLSSLGKLYTQGVPINWKGFHQFTGGNKIDIPGYSFDETQKYWMNLNDDESAPFHPLLGSNFPNASDKIIFHSKVHLGSFGFIKDHLIENKPVFLCAGYMEILLAALTSAKTGSRELPSQSVGIKDFGIKVPIIFDEANPKEFQVGNRIEGCGGELVGRIYTKITLDDGTSKWVENAKALATRIDKVEAPTLKDLTARCNLPMKERSQAQYEDSRVHGFNLGPSLQNAKEGWENPDCPTEFLIRLQSSESRADLDRFIMHPAITDPVLQSMGMEYWVNVLGNRHVGGKSLLVPVLVENFTRWSNQVPSSGYYYIKRTDEGYHGFIYDNDGTLIASLSGVEYVETTMSNLLALIDAERNPYTELGEIAWKEQLGPCDKRIGREQLDSISFKGYEEDIAQHRSFNEEEKFEFDAMEEATGRFILRVLSELGLQHYPEFSFPDICDTLGITKPNFQEYFRFLLLEMVKDGWITEGDDPNKFLLTKQFPTDAELRQQLDLIKNGRGENYKNVQASFDHFSKLVDNLKSILTGKTSAQPLLYPETEGEGGFAEFFFTKFVYGNTSMALINSVGLILADLAKKGKHVIRVLEIGGVGVMATTQLLIQKIVESGPHLFEYTSTDASPLLLEKKQMLFQNSGISCKFFTLNVDMDPLEQGLIPEYFDVVIASQVTHNTKVITHSMANIKKILRPGGLLVMNEPVEHYRTLTFAFGCLDGFWRSEETSLLQLNCELDICSWRGVLEGQGYWDFTAHSAYENKMALLLARNSGEGSLIHAQMLKNWIILGDPQCPMTSSLGQKLQGLGYTATFVSKESVNSEDDVKNIFDPLFEKENVAGIILLWGLQKGLKMEELCQRFLPVCKYLVQLRLSYTLQFMLVTQESVSTGSTDYVSSLPEPSAIIGMGNVLANECQDIRCKFVDYNSTMDSSAAVDSILSELFLQDEDTTVAFRNNHRLLPRLLTIKPKQDLLTIPDTPRYQLLIPNSHMTADLRFIPCEPQPVGADDVEIEVKAYSLNFRDVFVVSKPAEVFEKDDLLGTDICGVITAVGRNAAEEWRVGDRVMAIRRYGIALPSHVVIDYRDIFSLPIKATCLEGSTVPLAGVTVSTCLVYEAQVKEDDIVLVHTASGGVGLLAINFLLKVIKCQVVVTAGTERKRNFLRGLGVKHVFNSRDTMYGEQVREALGGRGVTVVLNSLTGPGFKEATLSICEKGARFIEISKLNIWNAEEVKLLRPDIDYKIVDVSALEKDVLHGMKKDLRYMFNDALADGNLEFKALPAVVFDCTEIRAALDYMEKVQHIGKVCIRMREQFTPSPYSSGVQSQFPLFNKDSSYVISGGLGGIGIEVAKWMVNQGAGTLVLLGRNPPKATTAQEIEKLKDRAQVVVKLCDVGNYEDLEAIFFSGEFPEIRGIIHCAGVLEDAPFEEQTWEKYQKTFGGKAQGAFNLHLLSTKLRTDMEHFVLFSSMTSTVGAPSQSNYVAANSYLDGLGAYRTSLGLPCLTINWGQWAQVGMAANLVNPFFKPFSVSKGIAVLEYALRYHKSNICAYEADLVSLKKALPSVRGLFADIEEKGSQLGVELDSEKLWAEYDAAGTPEDKREVIRKLIQQILRSTLKLPPTEEIDDNREFQEMGLDSLMMVEIKNSLQSSMKKRVKISITAVKDCNTVALLSTRLVELISGKEDAPPLTREELFLVVTKDWEMYAAKDHLESTICTESLVEIQNVSSVLVTGATGAIGSYVVHYLAEMPQITKIYCLVRPSVSATINDKFRSALLRKNLYSDNVKEKVVVVEGDVARIGFSIPDEDTFRMMAEQVEAIFHLARKVSFTERYRKTDDQNSCRMINVRGTDNILSFALYKRLKHVYCSSTFMVATQMDEEKGILSEEWPKIEEVNLYPDSGYLLSKLICEGMAEQFVGRGVPVKVCRFSYAGPDSATGKNIEYNQFAMMRAFAQMYLGCMPAISAPFNMLPVDLAAKLSVQIFFHPDAGSGIYNIANPHSDEESEFPELVAELGVKVDVIELDEFRERMRERKDDVGWRELDYLLGDTEQGVRTFQQMEAPIYLAWIRGHKGLFRSEKVERFVSTEGIPGSYEIFGAALRSAKKEGLFHKFRIPYTEEQK